MGLAGLVSMVVLIRLANLSPLSRFRLLDMTLDLKNKVCQYIKSGFKTSDRVDSVTSFVPDYDRITPDVPETSLEKTDAPNDGSTSIDDLPVEILQSILLYVDQPTKTVLVCRKWKDASNNLPTDWIKSTLAPHRWAEAFSPNVTTIEIYKRAVNNLLSEAREARLDMYWEFVGLFEPNKISRYTPTISVDCCEKLQKGISEHNFLSFYDYIRSDRAPCRVGWGLSQQELDARMQFNLQIQDRTSTLVTLTSFWYGSSTMTEIPVEIGQLQNLEVVNCSFIRLKTIPCEIGNLQRLKKLGLSHNNLGAVPKEIGQLRDLEQLDLSYNKVNTLPREIGNLQNLTRLKLSCNLLKTLPEEIGDLAMLEILDLSDNQLTALPSKVANLNKLVKFSIKSNPIPSLQPEILSIRALWRTAYLEAKRT